MRERTCWNPRIIRCTESARQRRAGGGREREAGVENIKAGRIFSREDNNVVGLRAAKQDKKLTLELILKFRIYR